MSNDTLDTDLNLELAADADVDLSGLPELRDRLVDDADAAGLVDVAYATVDSPPVRCCWRPPPMAWSRSPSPASSPRRRVLAELADRISPRLLRRPQRLDGVIRQLDDYFAGRRRDFELPLDLRLAHGFRRTVLDELRAVGYGTTVSYTELATAAGRPRAVRAAGSACATNPIPIVIPCHRVLRSDGSLGGYGGGLPAKRALLDLEQRAA